MSWLGFKLEIILAMFSLSVQPLLEYFKYKAEVHLNVHYHCLSSRMFLQKANWKAQLSFWNQSKLLFRYSIGGIHALKDF